MGKTLFNIKEDISSGVLAHITSLPGDYGIGTLGAESYAFVDFLKATKTKLWEICPLTPTGHGDSPYNCFSGFAGNPLLISFEKLDDYNLLGKENYYRFKNENSGIVDYGKVIDVKNRMLKIAFRNFEDSYDAYENEFVNFCDTNSYWLEDFSIFMSIKMNNGFKAWFDWDREVKFRDKKTIEQLKVELKDSIKYYKFLQFVFFKQWFELKEYANKNGIQIVGDLPINVSLDSSDVWCNPDIFMLNADLEPIDIAGVPADGYLTIDGAIWGNPVYRWDNLKKTNFKWWVDRIKIHAILFDKIRIDHFRGFVAYWAIPATETSPLNGRWEKSLGRELFVEIKQQLGDLDILFEDLGVITADVNELKEYLGFPGMNVVQYGFVSDKLAHFLPHNYTPNSVTYTSTHDSDTLVGWFKNNDEASQKIVCEYFGIGLESISWDIIKSVWASKSNIVITTMQDLLSLDNESRLNDPNSPYRGNWQWRFKAADYKMELIESLKALNESNNR